MTTPQPIKNILTQFWGVQAEECLEEIPIECLASALVLLVCDPTEDIGVTVGSEAVTTSIEFRLSPKNKGKVIGRNGHTIKAIRSICRAIERGRGKDVSIEVLDK